MRVELKHIFKTFPHNGIPVDVMRDVNLIIEEGEFVCLVGPSGCGKSTLINLIAGLVRPDQGEVLVDGKPVEGPGADRVVVFQEAALFPWLSVLGNVEFGLRMAGMPRPERRARALEHLKLVHLSRFIHHYPHQLSGGMRQRVALARALSMNPKILLMDEPFASLDAQTRRILERELEGIWRATHKTIFFVTHSVREAAYLADRVYEITARPGHIKREYKIELGRPRRDQHPLLLALQRKIVESLGEEIEKVMQEELDVEQVAAQNGVLLPVRRGVSAKG